MREKTPKTKQEKKTHRRRVWWWLVLVILILAGATAWVLYDGGIIGQRNVGDSSGPVVTDVTVTENTVTAPESTETADKSIRSACQVIESTLLSGIYDDDNPNWQYQQQSADIYTILAQRGCPENAQLFQDLAARKQAIADGLRMATGETDNGAMTTLEYLYSDEKICETIENRVMRNINTSAYSYDDFLQNAKTYATLYEYGCKDHRGAYMRAALRELGVAVALMPTDKMSRDEIMTVVEICKSLGVADAAHLMVQRLKARGYDMDFLLEIEDIIHGIR